jgi:ribonuclease-3
MTDISKYFKDKIDLEKALTHKSWVNEHSKTRESNERLEFLGDAILEFIVSEDIYKRFPDKEEGYLTALRSNLVNTKNLASVAEKLKLGEKLFLSKGEEDGGGRTNTSILADTVEAIIGAMFLEGGIKLAKKFINENLLNDVENKIAKPLKDAKSRLQEMVQSKGYKAPIYKVVKESGPDHDKSFTLEVFVDGKSWGEGAGKNKGEAAQNAAENALSNVKNT